MKNLIQIKNINISYERNLIKDGEINLYSGLVHLIYGESGSGKTSLLYEIGLLTSSSDYYVNGNKLDSKNKTLKTEFRRKHISFVLQDYLMFKKSNVYEMLSYYALMNNIKLNNEIAKKYLDKVNLKVDLYHKIEDLSGGEKQRVAIACALIKGAEIIILDEPSSALDEKNEQILLNLLTQLARNENKCIVITSHREKIKEYADVVYQINNQKIELIRENLESLSCDFNFKNNKLNSNIYKKYLLFQYKNYFLNHFFVYLSLLVAIGAFTLVVFFGNDYEKQQIASVTEMSSLKIYLPYETDFVFSDKEVVKYPFFSSKVIVTEKNYAKEYSVIPYYPEDHVEDKIKLSLDEKGKIFASDEILKIGNSVLNKDFFKGIIGEEYTLGGILFDDIKNYYSTHNKEAFLMVPYNALNDRKLVQEGIVVFASNYTEYKEYYQHLRNQNKELVLFDNIEELDKLIESSDFMIRVLKFVVYFLITGVVIFIYAYKNKKSEYDFILLVLMGVTINKINRILLLDLLINACLVLPLVYLFAYHFEVTSVISYFIFLVTLISVINLAIALRLQPIKYLRKRIN